MNSTDYIKDKPAVIIGGRTQTALDAKNGPERFNFLPREKPCDKCGGSDFAYTAFNMTDGRLTVMWMCRKCGKEAMLSKVRFESNEDSAVRALNDAVLNAYMMDRPSMAKAIQMATVEAEILCNTLYVRFHFTQKGMMFAKLLKEKLNDMMQYYDLAAINNSRIRNVTLLVNVDRQPLETGGMSDSVKAMLNAAYDVFWRKMEDK